VKRKSDGALVCVKHVPKDTQEVAIALYFSAPERRDHPTNHAIPVLDHFTAMLNGTEEYFIVMPLLRPFNDPPFFVVSEVIDFMQQTLAGLKFIHENDIAHRDFCFLNIMMDATPLYPDGFHPAAQQLTIDALDVAKHRQRCDVAEIKYYILDFGLSSRFEDSTQPRLVRGTTIQDHEVPELSDTTPYDPFPVDVFTLGNVFKQKLLQEYTNLSFLEPLISAMIKKNPKERPTISEAITMFDRIVATLRPYQLRWRLQLAKHGFGRRFYTNLHAVARECGHFWSWKKSPQKVKK